MPQIKMLLDNFGACGAHFREQKVGSIWQFF